MSRLSIRRHLGFIVLLILFVAGILFQQAVLPPIEGGDEYLNYSYVQLLLRENHLPNRATSATNSTQQQSGQPPLVYWTGAMLMRLANLTPDDDAAFWQRFQTHKNPWFSAPNEWNRVDNRNLFLHGSDDMTFATPEVALRDHVIRLTGLIFGLIALIGAYGAALEMFSRTAWALIATALTIFLPGIMHVSSFINTDIGMIAFAALATWAMLRLLRVGGTWKLCLILGLTLAVGALAKISILLVAPGAGVALLLDAYRRKRPLSRLIINGLLVALPLIVFFGPWVVFGWMNYGDPLGLNTHLRPGYFNPTPLTLIQLVPLLSEVYLGYWGKLASAVYLHPVTYTVLGTLLILTASGFIVALFRRSRWKLDLNNLRVQQVIVLITVIIFGIIGLIHWLQTIDFITGRLMYQAHPAVALLMTGGLYLLAARFPHWKRPLQAYSLGLIVFSGVFLAPMSLYTAFAPPTMLTQSQLPALSGTPVDFDHTIRFIGYTQDTSVLSGDLHTIQLCWQVLQPAARPGAFSVKIVHNGDIIGDRTSIHGLGRYDSSQWKPGDTWCDSVDVPITKTPQSGITYDVLLVMLDARTQAVDWHATAPDGTPIQYPFIAQVSAP